MPLRKLALRMLALLGMPLIALASFAGPPASAQAAQRCFPETGQCISGPIRSYWERNGGLPVFGFPITPQIIEQVEGQNYPVQWFQRDRLEDHGALGVMAGRLGAEILEAQGRPWWPDPYSADKRGCRYFPQTQHSVCEPFLSYWNRNGGLARFGFPLTESKSESVGNWIGEVQYFERRRMEHHEEFAGTRYEILLGLLGQTRRDLAALQACPVPIHEPWRVAFTLISFRGALGCPLPVHQGVPASYQSFERGSMNWIDLGEQGRKIYVSLPRPGDSTVTSTAVAYRVFDDTWDTSQPLDSGLTPPPDLLEPQRGFGKVWREHPDVRAQLGWATYGGEIPGTADYQAWSNGGAMLSFPYLDDKSMFHPFRPVYAFAPDGSIEVVLRPQPGDF